MRRAASASIRWEASINLAVNFGRQGRPGQAGPDICGNIQYGQGLFVAALTAVRQGNYGHIFSSNPDFSPGDAMFAPDFLRQWVPATESIAVALVEGARAHWRKKDKQGRTKRSL